MEKTVSLKIQKAPPVWIQDILRIMNEAVRLDDIGIQKLVESRVPCKTALAKHPTIQVGILGAVRRRYMVGTLGILNGITQAKGWRLEAMFDDDTGKLKKFQLWRGKTKRSGSRPWKPGKVFQ